MTEKLPDRLRRGVLIAPLDFVAHFLEESPTFVAWFSFLMLTNAIFHITGAIIDRAYVPGLVTAVGLYVPYCIWLGVQVVRSRCIAPSLVAVGALLGGLPTDTAFCFWEVGYSRSLAGKWDSRPGCHSMNQQGRQRHLTDL